ncbi:hypothetical protein E1508_06520 [Pseudomonas moraviensis]|nr:hypothetical protein E1508_06520 [Pseudomonas moraviensis]
MSRRRPRHCSKSSVLPWRTSSVRLKSCWKTKSDSYVVRADAFASRLAPTGKCIPMWERACSRKRWFRQHRTA